MRLLITAGPTREPLDAVRFLSNRSSGKVGLALAAAGLAAGHDVTLLLGPGPETSDVQRLLGIGGAAPSANQKSEIRNQKSRIRLYRFESSTELKQLAEAHFRDCDALLMAAAVADYRPAQVIDGKLPRDAGKPLVLRLEPTPDIVALLAARKRPGQKVVAFALEEAAHLEQRAAEKLRRKGVDAIVANPLGTMEADAITAVWLSADGAREAPGRMSKADFARWLIGKVETLT